MFTLKDNLKTKITYYVVLVFVIVFYAIEFGIGHYTHTLVLLMDSYCTLCNILGLLAVIVANKFGQSASETTLDNLVIWTTNIPVVLGNDDNKLRNTFGWKRYLTLSLLIRYIFLLSTAFSVSLEALQALIEAENYANKIHFELTLYVAIAGLLLYIVFHLVICDYINYFDTPLKNVPSNAITNSPANDVTETLPESNNCRRKTKSILSDFIGPTFVILYCAITYFTDLRFMTYTDSILTLLLGVSQLILNFSLMKESCAILLQKIPDTIDIDNLRTQLLQSFPDVLNIHDFHIWQLTTEKVVSTVHITFKNPTVYPKLTRSLLVFFQKFGIDEATIQPEFFKDESTRAIEFGNNTPSCLMECQNDDCKQNFCCPKFPQVVSRKNKNNVYKESIVDCSSVSIKSMTVYSTQQTFLNKSFSND